MAWSLSLREFRQPLLAEELLLAAGKALYLANAFETKCQYVLRILNLVQIVESDPVLTLEQAFAALPQDKMLAATVQDITGYQLSSDMAKMDLLHRARRARNFIAHEGMSTGPIWGLHRQTIIEHTGRLRAAVADLAAGDNVVSAWCYEIDEKEPAPRDFTSAYPDMVATWIFGRLDLLITQTEGEPDDREPTLAEYLKQRSTTQSGQ
ncbi:hypothetical protein [Actinoplanes derwentensis]|uniref:hypothetical protein n=1 Tax=Actinoplanes derwentensis TaxID=113562 RepID=UPI000B87ADA5|nr:hypothetical protein [Actinoplanes derwentensis]